MEIETCPIQERLIKFRQLLKSLGVDGYIVTHNDAHDVFSNI